ncbi:MAG: hypothetical protein ACRDP1_06730 [Nocardioidaceae bacterium]
MLPEAQVLTHDLHHRWLAAGRDQGAFARLAQDCLLEHPLWQATTMRHFANTLREPGIICEQFDVHGAVGRAPLTLAVAPENAFYVTAAIWFSEDMAIHDHNFVGAFAVASGDCRHSVYNYDVEVSLGDLDVGSLTATVNEPLVPGTVRPILSGRDFIHKNVHLTKPTLTIVVAAPVDGVPRQQYLSSGVSLMSKPPDTVARRLHLLAALLRVNDPEAVDFMRSVLGRPVSAAEWFRAVHTWHRCRPDAQELTDMVAATPSPFGSSVSSALLQAVFHDLRYKRTDQRAVC